MVILQPIQLYVRKGTISHILKYVYFKEAYFHNTMHNLNRAGTAAPLTQKWRLMTEPSGSYGTEFTIIAIVESFSEMALLRRHVSLEQRELLTSSVGWHYLKVSSYLYCTKNYSAVHLRCGKKQQSQILNKLALLVGNKTLGKHCWGNGNSVEQTLDVPFTAFPHF